jgi:hypothetical protein
MLKRGGIINKISLDRAFVARDVRSNHARYIQQSGRNQATVHHSLVPKIGMCSHGLTASPLCPSITGITAAAFWDRSLIFTHEWPYRMLNII